VLSKMFKLFTYFSNPINLINMDRFEDLIKSIIIESRVEPVKIVKPIEQYTIDDEIKVVVGNRNGSLEYIVVEPEYDDEIIYAVSRIYAINPYCEDLVCIEKTIASSNDERLRQIFSKQPLNIAYYYKKVASGYGSLYPLVKDPYIEEIASSADDQYVSIIHRKYSWYGWMKTNIKVSEKGIDRIVLSLARKIGKHLSYTHPVAEGLTPEGLRISLTYGREVSRKGSSFVIRKKPISPWTITKLIDSGTLSALIASYLWLVMEFRGSILIVGGVSSGKTTLLQSLLTLIPPSRRVVSIEDTPELMGSTGYWDPLVERVVSVGEGVNIDMYSLLRFSLRRRADYLVVGEVRGVEARLLVQASRLGHGVLATLHAESASSALERLISPPISIPKKLLSNIWCIVVMENVHGIRRVKNVYEVGGDLKQYEIFRYSPTKGFMPKKPDDLVEKTVRLTSILEKEILIEELVSRTAFLEKLVSRGVFGIDSLSLELNNYYYEMLEGEVLQVEHTT